MRSDSRSPIDGDPLAAIRGELVAAARRRLLARRRRRRTLATAIATLGLLTVTSGALALTDIGTGVPSIDRFLNTAPEPPGAPAGVPPKDHAPSSQSLNPPPPTNFEPAAGSASPPLDVSLGGGERAQAVGYATRDGKMCAALVRADAPSEQPGFAGCASATMLADTLSRFAASTVSAGGMRAGGGDSASTLLIQGFARENVTSVTVIAPGGRVRAALSDAWMPGAREGGRLRVFFAVVHRESVKDIRTFAAVGLPLEVQLADGSIVKSDGSL